ncbi:MAG: hypothetical protein ABJN26_09080 [Stappiaceae bacterium]
MLHDGAKPIVSSVGTGRIPAHILFDPGTDDVVMGLLMLACKERFDARSFIVSYGNVTRQ